LEHDLGAIDFILAGRQTKLTPWVYRFNDQDIPVEFPGEILAKKLKYRGSRFLPRDVFDLLAIYNHDPKQVRVAIEVSRDGARRAVDRIKRISQRYRESIQDEVNPTQTGLELIDADPNETVEILLNAMK